MAAQANPSYHLATQVVTGLRDVNSYGPHWVEQAYYDETYVSPNYGPLDPYRMVLEFTADEAHLPYPDFAPVTGLIDCPEHMYETLFRELVEDYVKLFRFMIEDIHYVAFRPTAFLPLDVDFERSIYLERPGREPYAFRKIVLKEPPPDVPIFSLAWPVSTRYQQIVRQDFVEICLANGLTGLNFSEVYPAR